MARLGSALARTRLLLLAVALLAPQARGIDWFGDAYRRHVEFGVMSRTFEKSLGDGKLTKYVLLTSAMAGPLVNARPVNLPEPEVMAAVHTALTQAGYTPAASSAEAEIAIVVTYGHGEYPPPFDFMGVDPVSTPSFRWPPLLKQYEQQYFRRDYLNTVETGFVEQGAATERDLVNFVGIRAFDARALREKKRWTLRWETRVTVEAFERPLADYFKAMILVGADSFGRDNRNGHLRSAPIRDGQVIVGDAVVVEMVPAPQEKP
jgi:hypothetical protein